MKTARTLLSLLSFILLLLLALCLAPAYAQTHAPLTANCTPHSANAYQRNSDQQAMQEMTQDAPPIAGSRTDGAREKLATERSQRRQMKIASESTQLLALAQKLNADLARSSPNQLSVSVVKEAAEIEKLAKSIKTKVRDGR